jgi:hypothetical protein
VTLGAALIFVLSSYWIEAEQNDMRMQDILWQDVTSQPPGAPPRTGR